jgi:hypothetical protein
MIEYFYPDDIIITTDELGRREARLGYKHMCVYDGRISFQSDMPIYFTDAEIETVITAYHKVWLAARERHRKEELNKFYDYREIVMAFWKAHEVENYNPKHPAWTVSSHGPNAVTKQSIMEWSNHYQYDKSQE